MHDEIKNTKISIITAAPRVRNYGSILLTYATKRLFEEMNFIVEFVDYTRRTLEEAESLKETYNALKKRDFCKRWPKFLLALSAVAIYPSVRMQNKRFQPFIRERIPVTVDRYTDVQSLMDNPPLADVYCTGGDQMWNEQHNFHRTLKEFYLSYAPQGKPRVSFSTSIGKEKYDDWEISEVRPLLKEYKLISVRERSAQKDLSRIGIQNVLHIIDPTILLERVEWEEMASPRLIKDEYILIYQMSRRVSLEKAAIALSRKTGKKIIRIDYYMFDMLKKGKSILCPTPEEFLSLFCHADCIITNSFHGVAFSVAFKRNFIVVPGANPARLQGMLEYLGLEDRICTEPQKAVEQYQLPIDYSAVDEQLAMARKEKDIYIRKIKEFCRL